MLLNGLKQVAGWEDRMQNEDVLRSARWIQQDVEYTYIYEYFNICIYILMFIFMCVGIHAHTHARTLALIPLSRILRVGCQVSDMSLEGRCRPNIQCL